MKILSFSVFIATTLFLAVGASAATCQREFCVGDEVVMKFTGGPNGGSRVTGVNKTVVKGFDEEGIKVLVGGLTTIVEPTRLISLKDTPCSEEPCQHMDVKFVSVDSHYRTDELQSGKLLARDGDHAVVSSLKNGSERILYLPASGLGYKSEKVPDAIEPGTSLTIFGESFLRSVKVARESPNGDIFFWDRLGKLEKVNKKDLPRGVSEKGKCNAAGVCVGERLFCGRTISDTYRFKSNPAFLKNISETFAGVGTVFENSSKVQIDDSRLSGNLYDPTLINNKECVANACAGAVLEEQVSGKEKKHTKLFLGTVEQGGKTMAATINVGFNDHELPNNSNVLCPKVSLLSEDEIRQKYKPRALLAGAQKAPKDAVAGCSVKIKNAYRDDELSSDFVEKALRSKGYNVVSGFQSAHLRLAVTNDGEEGIVSCPKVDMWMNPFWFMAGSCKTGNLGFHSLTLEEEVAGSKVIHWGKFRTSQPNDIKSAIERLPDCSELRKSATSSSVEESADSATVPAQ